MRDVDYTNYNKLAEVRPHDTNSFLDLGWKLLFIGQHKNEDYAEVTCCVGWPKDQGEVKMPKDKYDYLA